MKIFWSVIMALMIGTACGAHGIVDEKKSGSKLIALSIDDGPSVKTELLMDIINSRIDTATFLVFGLISARILNRQNACTGRAMRLVTIRQATTALELKARPVKKQLLIVSSQFRP
jgi:hypothetical protein